MIARQKEGKKTKWISRKETKKKKTNGIIENISGQNNIFRS